MTCSSAAAATLVITNILPPRIRKSRRVLSMVSASSEDPRIVRLVTRQARFAAGVFLDVHRRVPLRLAGVRRVAVRAERCGDRQPGLGRVDAAGVGAERSVARLAGDALVARLGAKVDDVHVALGAGGLPRVHRLLRAYVVDGVGAVVSELPEALRHQFRARNGKHEHSGQEQRGQADQVLDILETLHASTPVSTGDSPSRCWTGCNRCAAAVTRRFGRISARRTAARPTGAGFSARPDVRRPTSDVRGPTSDAGRPTSDILKPWTPTACRSATSRRPWRQTPRAASRRRTSRRGWRATGPT